MATVAAEQNESYRAFLREFPKTGPGTRAGAMLRHYWHPVCLSADLKDIPYAVRMLGEDLVAYRGIDGKVGLIGVQCAHRCASLEYAHIKANGLQCSYHGWTYDTRGRCVDMPLEPADSKLKSRVRQPWYPTEEWAGVVWCYMGPDKENPPPLHKIDILARADGEMILQRGDVRNYSYLNFLENFVDIGHSYVLHLLVQPPVPAELVPYCDQTVDLDFRRMVHKVVETDFGLKSVLVHNTADPNVKYVNTWSMALPSHFRFCGLTAGLPPDFTNDRREGGGMLRIIDDEHFEIFRYTLIRPGNFRGTIFPRVSDTARGLAEGLQGVTERKPHDNRKYAAWEGRPPLEDLVMQETQGVIPDRESEFLVSSDVGVAMLRRMWRKSMDDVAAGRRAKAHVLDNEGVFETDTFKGLVAPDQITIGPRNMPSSKDGRGLIRDRDGRLVFA